MGVVTYMNNMAGKKLTYPSTQPISYLKSYTVIDESNKPWHCALYESDL